MKDTIWIYDEDHRKLRRVARDRLEFPEYAPTNRARFKAGKKSWYYVYYGETAEECCDRANEHVARARRSLPRVRCRRSRTGAWCRRRGGTTDV